MKSKGAEQDVLKRDLAIAAAMADGMADYVRSDVTWWDMGRQDMPLLTIGGYLMRRRRLGALAFLLHEPEQQSMMAANATFDRFMGDHIVRFEERASSELGARIREWTVYLRDLTLSHRLAADTTRYDYLADNRVIIDELVQKLSEAPFKLAEHVRNDVAALDHRLMARWTPGAFIWSPVWSPAYPSDVYWWLYGHPKAD